MRAGRAALGLAVLGAACAPKPPPTPPPQVTAAMATVPAALDAAEAALRSCPQPAIAVRARIALQTARAESRAVDGGDIGALVGLDTNLKLLKASVDLCNEIARAVADYRAHCQGEARLGMTEDEVKATVWCAPTRTQSSQTATGAREEWTYRASRGIPGLDRPAGTLVFANGRLISIRRSAP